MNFIDLTGKRFGRLTVIEQVGKANNHGVLWRCKCDCGNEKNVRSNYLRSGGTTSCGCYRLEQKKEQFKRSAEWKTTHGMSNTPLYRQWRAMKNRCYNKKQNMYPRYGGRGIKVCEEWQKFEPFMEWALAHGYKEHLALDRIDGDGDYSPDNCRWVTQAENNRNKSNLIYLTARGETHLLVDWAKMTNQPKARLYGRHNSGWTDEEIIFGGTRARV